MGWRGLSRGLDPNASRLPVAFSQVESLETEALVYTGVL